VFVPIGCDFRAPRPDLLDIVRQWNAQEYPATGVWAVAATFDHYVTLVGAHRRALTVRRFDPTPYWQGFYASRPALKAQHLAAVRALLAAEVLGAIADGALSRDRAAWSARVAARSAALHSAWATLVPSNHHDYVTGTAVDAVYQGEQLPRLAEARAQAEAARAEATAEIARALRRPGIVVLNPLGFARRGLVELADSSTGVPRATAVQRTAEGTLLFFGRAPSLGYASGPRATARPPHPAVSVEALPDGEGFVLANGLVRATIRRAAGWGITALVDGRTGRNVLAPGTVANTLVVYADDGGLYRFGDEMAGCALVPAPGGADVGGTASAATVLETGPLRARVRGAVTLGDQVFVKEYQLVAGEPMLRMVTTGGAPPGTSVLVSLPLASPIDTVEHGTPYHWDRKAAERAGPLTFEPTHDFVIARRRGHAVAALFHDGVPAWAAQRDGVLLGALWRNAPKERCDYYGAQGTDPETHTVAYALRVPSGVASPRSGRQLREALAYATPLAATLAPGGPGTLPARFSLAAAAPPRAILTAAKAATADPTALVLRIYQPTNRPLGVTVRTGARRRFPRRVRLDVAGTTALETPLAPARARALAITGNARRFRVFTERALTTVEIRER
jgi:alpha-mannosidase